MTLLYDTVRTPKFPVISWLLVGLNTLAFLGEIGMESAELQACLFENGLIPAQLIANPEGEWTTIFSSIIEIPAILFLVFWFVSPLYSGLGALQGCVESGIAWWAHIGGFASGVLMVLFFRRRALYQNY